REPWIIRNSDFVISIPPLSQPPALPYHVTSFKESDEMKGGAIVVLTASAMYLAALGCAMWPFGATSGKTVGVAEGDPVYSVPSAKLDGLPYRGMVLQVQRIDSPDVYQKAIDDIVAEGADTVEIVVDSKQE